MATLDWQPWQTAAFLGAQRQQRPVLLLIEAAWAPACALAHAEVFSRPDVCEAIRATCIAVRVDADRRPDIADRYGLGHWPTLLFLTPDGSVLTGGTHLDATLASRVRQVVEAFATPGARWPARRQVRAPGGPRDEGAALAAIADAVWATRDPHTGAFDRGDLPSMAAANFALAHATATASDAWGQAAVDTVDAIARSSAWSAERGLLGCDPRDQGRPCRLDAQAEWVHLLTRVAPLEARPAWRDLLATAVAGLTAHFLRPDGHWRPWSDAPRLVLVDASARAARALLAAADLLEDPALATRTIDTLDALASAAYARAAGVAHLLDAEPRGPMLLTDAMLLAHALLDADPWRGESTVYRDLAEEILRTTVARLQDDSGAVRDRVAALAGAGQVGRLADPHFPLDGNAEAARLIRRLFPDDVEWLARARRMLVAISGEAAEAGVYAAPVGLAWHALGPSGEVMAVW